LLSANPEDVIFTGGSTESNNLVLSVQGEIFSTPIEHPSILEPFRLKSPYADRLIRVASTGLIAIDHLTELLRARNDTKLVTVIATNNETGTEQHLADIAEVCKHYKALLHIDATQTVGTRQIDLSALPVSAVSLSGHKIHGPKGVGALIAKSNVRRLLKPLLLGGGQERAIRSGTLNVPGIIGFGAAASLLSDKASCFRSHFTELRHAFLTTLREYAGTEVIETVTSEFTSPHIVSVRVEGVNGRALLGAVGSQVCFSLGSACATNKSEPSHVLLALGFAKSEIARTIRFSFSREQNTSDIVEAAKAVGLAASRLLALSMA
jgi:cysteine desulfurase